MARALAASCVFLAAACGLSVTGVDPLPTGEPAGTAASDPPGADGGGVTIEQDASGSTCPVSTATDGAAGALDGANGDAGPSKQDPPDFCTSAGLVACYRFEGSVVDESAPAIGAPVISTGVAFAPGRIGQALRATPSMVLHLPNDASWNVSSATVEMWINVESFPAGTERAGLFDNQRAYAVFLHGPGFVRCGIAELDSAALPAKQWVHVACVWDNAIDRVTVYVNGVVTGTKSSPLMPVSTSDKSAIGSNIPSGEPFDGRIDNLRVWSTVRTPQQIAAAAAL